MGLRAYLTAAPASAYLINPVVEDGLDDFGYLAQGWFVRSVDLGECQGRSGLLVNHLPKLVLALHNAVGDSHITAQSRQELNYVNYVNIVGDGNQLSSLELQQRSERQ